MVGCESCVEFDFMCISNLFGFESMINLLGIRNEKSRKKKNSPLRVGNGKSFTTI